MINWLTGQLNEVSILWLLLSTIGGGVIGASLRFLFDYLVPENLKTRKEIIAVKTKYAVPIFYSAVELRKRLDNIIQFIRQIEKEPGWLDKDDRDDDYYFLSTIYLVAQFLGWMRILRRTVVYLDLTNTQETKAYSYGLDAVASSFSDPRLIQESSRSDPQQTEDKWIYSIWLDAIGDQMVTKNVEDYRVLSFPEFYQKQTDTKEVEFQKWMKPLVDFFDKLKSNQIRYHRIIAIHAIVNAFIELNDPRFVRSKSWPCYWELLLPKERDKVIGTIRNFYSRFKVNLACPPPKTIPDLISKKGE